MNADQKLAAKQLAIVTAVYAARWGAMLAVFGGIIALMAQAR